MTMKLRVIPRSNTNDRDWRDRALCGDDPDLWYPHPKSSNAIIAAQTAEAKRICRNCPVLKQCRADVQAIEGGTGPNSRWGIRAGMTPQERHNEWRRTHRGEVAA